LSEIHRAVHVFFLNTCMAIARKVSCTRLVSVPVRQCARATGIA